MAIHPRTLVWAESAMWMLEEALASIYARTPIAGDDFLEVVLRDASELERFAGDGRVVPELGRDDVREIFVGQYRLQYHLRPEVCEIVAFTREP